jgi:hypothetical protein
MILKLEVDVELALANLCKAEFGLGLAQYSSSYDLKLTVPKDEYLLFLDSPNDYDYSLHCIFKSHCFDVYQSGFSIFTSTHEV